MLLRFYFPVQVVNHLFAVKRIETAGSVFIKWLNVIFRHQLAAVIRYILCQSVEAKLCSLVVEQHHCLRNQFPNLVGSVTISIVRSQHHMEQNRVLRSHDFCKHLRDHFWWDGNINFLAIARVIVVECVPLVFTSGLVIDVREAFNILHVHRKFAQVENWVV